MRLLGTERATQYGYSLFEFQVYNVPQCGPGERYTLNAGNPNLVLDNLLGLTWTRTIKTDTATGSQFTGIDAQNYCQSLGMRLPTQAEALGIGGNNNASCAFPGAWNTWTSTVDPQDASETALVNFDGTSSYKVTVNWPGAVLCAAGTSAAQAPAITAQPQAQTVTAGQSATFSVTATGAPSPGFQWLRGGTAIAGATASTYITPATSSADNNAVFSVVVSNASGTLASQPAQLTVTAAAAAPTPPPANPAGGGNTAVPGFGTGPTPAGPNLARGKTATSSGDENSASLPPAAAFDGDLTTRWSSAFADAEWLQVDLGSVQPVGQAVLRWERAYGTRYQVLASADGTAWTVAYTQNAGQGGSENLVFPPVNARYLRMNGIARATGYGYSLWEFEVYGPVLPTIVTQPVSQTVSAGAQAQFTVVAGGNAPFTYQWAHNGTAIAGANAATYTTPSLYSGDSGGQYSVTVTNSGGSVTSSAATVTVTTPAASSTNLALYKSATSSGDENPGLAPLNAVDGSLNTRWSSAFTDSAWFQVDLGSPLLVSRVVLYWEAAYGRSYLLESSNDGVTWATVVTQTAGTGGVETLNFPAINTRFLRLQGVRRATPYGYSLYEFQAFGANLPVLTSQPAATSVNAGASAAFQVVTGSNGPFSYQWARNGVALAGATSSTYTTPVVYTADSGSVFTVQVTNAAGTTTSAGATLTVVSPAPATPNLALGQPATDSSSQDEKTLGAAQAVDGNTATRWASAGGIDPSWLTVDLGAATSINQVVLRWEAAYGSAYQIQVSPDASNWSTVYTQPAGHGGVETISFAPVTARFVRMFGTARGTQYGYSLYEFQVYGTPAPAGSSYTVYPGFLGVDLVNNTGGVWADNQVYVTVIGLDPANNRFAYLTPSGSIVDFTANDASASSHITSPGNQSFGNYSFTLAQSKLLKLPLFTSARAYVSLGAPLYVPVYADNAGNITGYAGPNPQNPQDPNINTHFDWYEFNYGSNGTVSTVYINTTQVDEFGLPLLLDVYAAGGSFHQQTGIAESIAQIDQEYAAEVPAPFQPANGISNLRIPSPAKMQLAAGAAFGTYFDDAVARAWQNYSTNPLSITLNGRTFSGTAKGSTLAFQEVNPAAAFAGETFTIQQPSTQDILGCRRTIENGVAGSGTAAGDENAVQLQLQNQVCSAINRGVLATPANWKNVSAYYTGTPANFYAGFWHRHSVGGLAYGFSYDDNNNQSTTITTQQPEHMRFTIGW